MAIDRNKVLASAQKHTLKESWDKAVKDYLLLVEDDPTDMRSMLKIGDLYAKMDRHRDALEAYVAVSHFYSQREEWEKAIAVYKQALRLHSDQAPVLYRIMGEAYHKLGRVRDAGSAFLAALNIYRERQDNDSQRGILELMVNYDPEDLGLRLQLAERYAWDNFIEESLEMFLSCVEVLREEGRKAEIVPVTERVLFLDGDNTELRLEVIDICLELSDLKTALKHLQVLFKTRPHDIEVLSRLGQTFEGMARPDKALLVYVELAELYGKEGLKAACQTTWQKVLELDPQNREARQALGQASQPTAALEQSGELARGYDTDGIRSRALTPVPAAMSGPTTSPRLAAPEAADLAVPVLDVMPLQGYPQATPSSRAPQVLHPGVGALPGAFAPMAVPSSLAASLTPAASRPASLPEVLDISDELDALDAMEPLDVLEEFDDNEFLAPAAPVLATRLAEDPRLAQTLAECDVFIKYGLHDRALDLLGSLVVQHPESLGTHERLMLLYEAMGDRARQASQLLKLAGLHGVDLAHARTLVEQALSLGASAQDAATTCQRLGIAPVQAVVSAPAGLEDPWAMHMSVEHADFDDDLLALLGGDEESVQEMEDLEVSLEEPSLILPGFGPSAASPAQAGGEAFGRASSYVDLEGIDLSEHTAPELANPEEDIFDDLFGDIHANPSGHVNLGVDDVAGEMADIDFFIQQGLTDMAEEALDTFQAQYPRHAGIAMRRAQIEAVRAGLEPDLNPFGAPGLAPLGASAPEAAPTDHELGEDFDGLLNSNLELGVTYRDMGLYEEAIEEFRLALSDSQARTLALYNIGVTQRDMGDVSGAVATLHQLLATPGLDPVTREGVLHLVQELRR